ncbi:hypothetical protein, partial [Actinoplanes sp. GCM10030250]|uniref:hypothetical protein n=1 Tax=Actinoplanes sp. GCM10030250 TaxID=3273376 RepID=UPI0036116160
MRPLDTTTPADPPIVTTLLEPLLELRAALGDGRGRPDPVGSLSAATAVTAAADDPARAGAYALESTDT